MTRPRVATSVRWAPGDPSKYLRRLSDIPVSMPVVLYLRVSRSKQEGNLKHQETACRRALADYVIIKVFRSAGESGRITRRRDVLEAAIIYAAEHGAAVVGHDRERFIRSRSKKDAVATNFEFQELEWFAGTVPLATILDPNATAAEIRSAQVRRSNPGRPANREAKRHKSLQMLESGISIRRIARELDTPLSTVRRWVKTPR